MTQSNMTYPNFDPTGHASHSISATATTTTTTTAATVATTAPTFGLLDNRTKELFIMVNHVVLSSAIGLFGIGANIVNMCVFLKQGLTNSMNISFFAIAISDLCAILTVLWLNVCLNPYIDRVDAPLEFDEIQYLTAGWPNGAAARITCWVTAYITAERCLSIALPLKVKRIVTTPRTSFIIFLIYLINILSLVPEYASVYFGWNFYPGRNRSLLGLAFRSNRPATEGLVFNFHASLAILAFAAVVTFTSVLVYNLKRKAKWRKSTTFAKEQHETMTLRDKKTVAMVTLVATVLIICYTPTVTFSIVSSLVPDFSVVGKQVNIFHACWSFVFLLHTFNASVNIFLYYKMSSRYRRTCDQVFARCSRQAEFVSCTQEDVGSS